MLTYFKYILSLVSSKNKRLKAFSLVELMIVTAIATIMMIALVVQQNKWNSNLALSSQAYEMVLMIRQAQIFGLGVRENKDVAGDSFGVGYGVYLSSENSDAFTRYILFADVNHNGFYEPGIDNVMETKYLNRGVIIDRFCGIKGNNADRCSPGIGNVSYMHITFFRPEPEATIIMRNSGGGPANNVLPPAKIFLKSNNGEYYYVLVEENGQISSGAGNSL